MACIGAIVTSTYHTRQLNPWRNSSANRVVNYSRLSACQLSQGRWTTRAVIWRLARTHSWTYEKLQKQAKAKAAWVTFSIKTWICVYSYPLMVKMCLAVVCAHGRRLFSNPVTYYNLVFSCTIIIVLSIKLIHIVTYYTIHMQPYGCWSITEKSVRPGRFWRDRSLARNYNSRTTYNLGQRTLA